jgi:hypothetical protein
MGHALEGTNEGIAGAAELTGCAVRVIRRLAAYRVCLQLVLSRAIAARLRRNPPVDPVENVSGPLLTAPRISYSGRSAEVRCEKNRASHCFGSRFRNGQHNRADLSSPARAR